MKLKIFLCLTILSIFTTGCFGNGSDDVVGSFEKNYKNLKAYHIKGNLEILNNEDLYTYDVDVIFKKDDKYKVSLKNVNNNHEQIILKNEDGVYVLTPSLNKSFKFQSDWPYNNSQVYLIQSIVDDVRNDKERTITEKDGTYQITSTVNYPNNRKLVNQIVRLDKDYNLKEVRVVDENDITQMKMTFEIIDLTPNIESNAFNINSIMKTTDPDDDTNNNNTGSTAASIEELIYPLYVPSGTALTNQETVKTDIGERIIMTFDGEKPFLLVEETSSVSDEFEIIPTFGEPCVLNDTIAALTKTSITWSSNGIDYYLVSDVMSQDELLDIARSVNVIPSLK